jgi:low temperature requirement protein LtrA
MMARDPREPNRVATQLELFFDLISVIALASATAAFHHAISYGHGPDLLLNFCFMIAAIWWPWVTIRGLHPPLTMMMRSIAFSQSLS